MRVRYPRRWREDEESVRNLLVPARGTGDGAAVLIPLTEVADVRIVEGPASIKSEHGLLRKTIADYDPHTTVPPTPDEVRAALETAGRFVEEVVRLTTLPSPEPKP